MIERVRGGKPAFLLATCPRMDGHFLGDPLLKMSRKPVAEGRETIGKVMASAVSRGGGGLKDRAAGMTRMMSVMAAARRVPARDAKGDPMTVARKALRKFPEERNRIDQEAQEEIVRAVSEALGDEGEADHA